MTIARQKTPLRFLTFSIGISRRLVITWQHTYQVCPTDSLNVCHLITILVPSSSIQSQQSRRMISNVRFCLFLKNKAYGLYFCPIHILSCAKYIVSGPLADIVNMSVHKGVFPSKLKEAKVIPVYKSDDKTEPGNYRPISLLSIFNRIFEKLMYHRLKSFLDKNNILLSHSMVFVKSTPHSTLFLILLTSYKTTWI